MRISSCLFLAIGIAAAGAALRLAIPVTPADDAFREVLRFHRTLNPGS